MSFSRGEKILRAMHAALALIPGAVEVWRNAPLPTEVPLHGLVILRDGSADSQETLGGFDSVYVIHTVQIEIFVSSGADDERDRKFDDLLRACARALKSDETFGGLAYGVVLQRPEPLTESIPGGASVKAGTLYVRVDYEAPSAIE